MRKVAMVMIGALLLLLSVTCCTYSVILMHTEGEANDMVDDTDNITPTANVTIPLK